MSYKLNKTDGSLLIELVDGKIDTSSSNITLVGKNYQGFGEFINENFIKMLENFANTSQPNKPLRGQLWYDTAEGRLKIYDGTQFKSTDTTVYASSQPTSLTEGDIWIDGSNNQLYFYDGTDTILVGPQYTKTQLKSGNFVETIRDSTGQNKVVVRMYINGATIGIYAKEAFTPFPMITGFASLAIGFNISSAYNGFKWLGTATNAENLIDSGGTVYNPLDLFLRKDLAIGDAMAGKLTINSNSGIEVVGSSASLLFKTSGTDAILQNSTSDADIIIRAKQGSSVYDAMIFDASEKRVGINKSNPEYTLDVEGDLRISGDLLIQGESTYLDVTTLRVQDKQIELGITDDSTLLTDTEATGAGIIIPVTGDFKYLVWTESFSPTTIPIDTNDDSGLYGTGLGTEIPSAYTADNSWNISCNFNIPDLHSYKIGNLDIINKTSLGSSVVSSSLTSIGTLGELQVDNLTLDGNRLSSSNTLEISAVGTVDFLSTPKLINVGTPTSARIAALDSSAEDDDNFVATKGYVDGELGAVTEVMGMDVTGLGSGATLQTNVGIMLQELYPAATKSDGSIARVHTSAMSAVTGAIDVNTNVSKSFIAVDSAGTQNVSVVQDFSVTSPTASVSLTVTRTIMEYTVTASTWTYVSTTASAV